jgi:hypothetical protein
MAHAHARNLTLMPVNGNAHSLAIPVHAARERLTLAPVYRKSLEGYTEYKD